MKRIFCSLALAALLATGCWEAPKPEPLRFEVVGDSEFTVLSVTLHVSGETSGEDRGKKLTTLRVLFVGTAAGVTRPVMIADGHELFVRSHGTYHTSDGPQSSVEAKLPDGNVPEELVIRWAPGIATNETHLKLER